MNVPEHSLLKTAEFAQPSKVIDALGIQPGMIVADFGAGSGAYTLGIAKALSNAGRVYAVDVQKDLLRRLHTEASHKKVDKMIEFIWGDLEAKNGSKIADHQADLVLVSNILFQVPDKKALLVEALRVVKPTGRIAVIEWSDSFNGMGPRREDVVKPDECIAFAYAAGLSLTREFHAGAHHYGLFFNPAQRHL
ncbi:MAG TPA: methyltransferase domain-containing protein [Candidatus Paceibacterota bacterium]|nr:methyltransferase domain-containing protein [Candidatus Paceibacterota bacterium]